MIYNQNSQKMMTLKELGDNIILNDLNLIVSSNPYLAFFIMAGTLEFIARCKCQLEDFQDGSHTKGRFVEAINNIDALAAYRVLNFKDNDKDNNLLYNSIRCGLLHAGIPDKGIILSAEKNDLEKKVVGCKDLYEDIKKAWAEIKNDPKIDSYISTNIKLSTDGVLSGDTETIIEYIEKTS